MMFRGKLLAVFLSGLATTQAFSPASIGRSTFCNTRGSVAPTSLVNARTFELKVVSDASDEVSEPEAAVEEVEAVAEEAVAEEAVAEEAVGVAVAAEADPKKPQQREEEDINCVAYVVNLSYDTDHTQLREVFSQSGSVKKVFVPRNRETGQNKGIAFVTMESEEARDAAIAALNESDVGGRTIYVDKAKPRGEVSVKKEALTKLYIGNISYDTTAEDLEKYFGEYGEVSNVYLPVDRYSDQPRGFGFLAMKPADAEKAIEAFDGTDLDGRTVEVKVSLPRGTKGPRRRNETKVYVGNLSFDTEEQSLRDLFEEYGPIVDLYIPYDNSTGRPRGFAFISLEPEMAKKAIEEVDNYELDGRMLRVNEAQPRGSGGYNNEDVTNEW